MWVLFKDSGNTEISTIFYGKPNETDYPDAVEIESTDARYVKFMSTAVDPFNLKAQ